MDDFVDFDVTSRDGKYVCTWEWIDEGNCGDYDPDDPDDVKRLRFTVSEVGEEFNQLDDASYCTLMTPSTPHEKLVKFAHIILEAVMSTSYKRELEHLTWTEESEL